MLTFTLALLAEASQTIDLAPTVSSLGSLGFSVWYAWYTTTVVIPKLLDSHKQERAEMQERHDARVHELMNEIKEQRQQFAQLMAGKVAV